MPNAGIEPLEIHLASSGDLVLRGLTGEELEPAVLVGELIVNLVEPTNLKEIQLIFTGNAKVTWRDSSTHHFDHPLFFHDFSFLNPSSSSDPARPLNKGHSHTLQAGRHVFPFSLHIPGSLPASLRTYSGTCVVEYNLKAIATRPGFAADWKTRKLVRIARGFGVDAVEYNQTLEIENTWPGKVMYAFTIPHKAYAAGETIPVSVKFSPLAKGVRIVSLITTIREHTTVHSKSSSHSEARDATVVKYNFIPETGTSTSGHLSGTSTPHPSRMDSNVSLASMNHSAPAAPTNPGFTPTPSFTHPNTHGDVSHPPVASGSGTVWPGFPQRLQRVPGVPEVRGATQDEEYIDDGIDTEVDVVVDVPIPVWTAPTHTVFPVFINHKIKWSAFIKNPDGHVSELRCALPIHILASSLAEEARLASAGARNLLFGESGVLAHSDVPQVDLPSYEDHVMDRVANADTASYFSLAAGFLPTPWSARSTPGGTPAAGSPMTSPPPSRPGSPTRGYSSNPIASSVLAIAAGLNGQSRLAYNPHSSVLSRSSSGSVTPVTTVSPADMAEDLEDHRHWIDSELMNTLSLDHTSPPGSNPSSRPGSRPGSRPNSRPSSPDREYGTGATTPGGQSFSSTPSFDPAPSIARSGTSSTSGGGFFHLHLPKPLRPLTAFSRMSSTSSVNQISSSSAASIASSTSHHPSPSALSNALAAHAARANSAPSRSSFDVLTYSVMSNSPNGPSTTTSPSSSSPVVTSYLSQRDYHGSTSPSPVPSPNNGLAYQPEEEPPPVDLLSQVPSYDVAARWLGGGVVPIERSLPNYEDSS